MAKAYRAPLFAAHLRSLGWFPAVAIPAITSTICGLEAAWGILLISQIAGSVVLPGSIALIAALSLVTWYSVKSGKTEDCGCYAGFVRPSLSQSLSLNFVYIALLTGAMVLGPVSTFGVGEALYGAAGAAIVTALIAVISLRRNSEGTNASPLEPGRSWNAKWSGGFKPPAESEILISYLGPECPYCKRWIKVANAMASSPELPSVVGVVAVGVDRLERFGREHDIRFPVKRIRASEMTKIAPAVPTSVLVNRGKIEEVWMGDMPPDFVTRFISAFFPSQTQQT